jgi:hypothetical protein
MVTVDKVASASARLANRRARITQTGEFREESLFHLVGQWPALL